MTQTSPDVLLQEAAFFTHVSKLARRFSGKFLLAEDVDDFAQDIVLEYLENLREGRARMITTGLAGLVCTMVARRLRDQKRDETRRDMRHAELARRDAKRIHAWMSPDIYVEERELNEIIERTLATLTPMCRTAYLMVRDDEASYKDVARTLGITRGAVCGHVVAAKRRLRAALVDWDVEATREPAPVRELPAATHAQVLDQRNAVAA